jgi:hypothetical protein
MIRPCRKQDWTPPRYHIPDGYREIETESLEVAINTAVRRYLLGAPDVRVIDRRPTGRNPRINWRAIASELVYRPELAL